MTLLTQDNAHLLWQEALKDAESRCDISLQHDLEDYLVTMLVRYTTHPEITKQVFATEFLEAQQQATESRHFQLQSVGDKCLLFAGLFPKAAERRLVKISYFVTIGQSAYITIATENMNTLFGSLSHQFVVLMDVLQSIRDAPDLLPLEAYEQWSETGSLRALKLLQSYTMK